MWKCLVLVGLLVLGGCAQQLDRAEALGAAALSAKEDASALAVRGCKRYVCRTGSIGAIMDEFSTVEQQAGWAAICAKKASNPSLSAIY